MKDRQGSKLVEVFSIIKKRVKLILFITILAGLTSGIIGYYGAEPLYRTSASILLGKSNGEKITASDVSLYKDLSKTYMEIAMSRKVAEVTSQKLNDGTTTQDIQNSVVVKSSKDTQVITIYADAFTAKSAADRANTFVDAFIGESQGLLASGSFQIIDKALVPKGPSYISEIKTIIISLLVGLGCSMLLALFFEYGDRNIRSVKDIKKYIDLPVIGIIPKGKGSELVVKKKPESFASQAYRTLRTNIQFPLGNKNLNTILVTSAGTDEGRTTVAGNLALTLAQSGKKVLLIDCDLRNPSLHKVFKVSNRKGLSDILTENLEMRNTVIYISEKLDILTAGDLKPNATEMLSSPEMSNFLKELGNKYSNVIIDSPAILSVTDSQVLSTKVNGVVYVVGSHQSSIEGLKKSIELLKNVNANVIGVVLNKTERKSEGLNEYFKDKTKRIRINKKVEPKKALPKVAQLSK
ncbi:MAG: polysaccharide biosynthesis tyrosine autokinase [Clostridiaceae bacterium]|nr:polysaccharide biosynthesis tyrosine autokinase [Clostridiaceae bacterium]